MPLLPASFPLPGRLPGALIPFCLETLLNLNRGSWISYKYYFYDNLMTLLRFLFRRILNSVFGSATQFIGSSRFPNRMTLISCFMLQSLFQQTHHGLRFLIRLDKHGFAALKNDLFFCYFSHLSGFFSIISKNHAPIAVVMFHFQNIKMVFQMVVIEPFDFFPRACNLFECFFKHFEGIRNLVLGFDCYICKGLKSREIRNSFTRFSVIML